MSLVETAEALWREELIRYGIRSAGYVQISIKKKSISIESMLLLFQKEYGDDGVC